MLGFAEVTLFSFGALGLGIFLTFVFFALMLLTEHERYGWTAFLLIAAGAVCQVGGINILGWVAANLLTMVAIVLAYAFIGLVYSDCRVGSLLAVVFSLDAD